VALTNAAGNQARPASGRADDKGEQVARGKYLAHDVAHCVNCHTPTTEKGEPNLARLLQGAPIPFEPKKKGGKWADMSPDLTAGGLAGKWSEDQMVTFLTTGKNPDGEGPTPPMPVFRLSKEDALAVAAYLRSVPGKKLSDDH
jgi:mono/diheme cytochrome c family protein